MRRAILCTADAVEEAFYDAMQRGDLEAMMALWADDEDVLCIHPGSDRFIGLSAVRASWERIFRHGHVEIRRTDVQAHTGAVLAIHNVIEQTLALDPHGVGSGLQIVECIATNVYVKQADGWRIMLHHAALRQPHPADAEKLH
ncbi:MAG TPA: nuclear transport factor 2 family protein [Zeimonas sp.]|nr:nuclear transport factor 2 family protein [Zeimonas sp.]